MVRPVLSQHMAALLMQELAADRARARRARRVVQPAPDNRPPSVLTALWIAIRYPRRARTA